MTINEKFNAFIDRLTTDKNLRTDFANDPRGVLAKEGIKVPEEMIPPKVEVGVLEERLNALNAFTKQFSQPGLLQPDKLSILASRSFEIPGRIPSKGPIASNATNTVI